MSDEPLSRAQRYEAVSRRWQRIHPWIASALIVIALGNLIQVPYYSLGPGPATNVLTLVKVKGQDTYPAEGSLLLTTASLSRRALTVFEYAWTFVDPALAAIPSRLVVPPGRTDEQQAEQHQYQMAQSKFDAERAAFAAVGLPAPRIRGANVLTVFEGAPADGRLEPGDRILAVDGRAVPGPIEAVEAIRRRAVGDEVALRVARDGRTRTERVTLDASTDDPTVPRIGAALSFAFRFPAEVEIDTMRIGGPSGGLVFALALVELLNDEDLTRGRTIAVTGTISLEDGVAVVGAVGGVEEKVRGAKALGAEMFIVPKGNEADALRSAPDDLRIVAVSTLDEALEALRRS